MLDRLIAILTARNLDLNPEAIADCLWLAQQIAARQTDTAAVPSAAPVPAPPEPVPASSEPVSGETPPEPPPIEPPPPLPPDPLPPLPPSPSTPSADIFSEPGEVNEYAFATPEAPPLNDRLALARALRPLLRRYPSRTLQTLDEAATVTRIAEADLWLPALRPAKERWLDLALVVEQVPSLQIWHATIRALHTLLAHHGAFRRVDLWSLAAAPKQGILLTPGLHDPTKRRGTQTPGLPDDRHSPAASHPRILHDPTGRRVILLISDATSAAWWQPSLREQLLNWGRHQPIAMIQVLPEPLWDRTVIGSFVDAEVTASAGALPNPALRVIATGSTAAPSMPLPISTLEPVVLARWAKLVAGQGEARAYALLLDGRPLPAPTPPATIEPIALVQRFLMTASPMAARLAGLFSGVAPITMRVMRVVQHALLPESNQTHLAEVFLSGLLERSDPPDITRPADDIRYEFLPEVRAQLRATVPTPAWVAALETVGAAIGARYGLGRDFAAWLRSSELAVDDERLPFARLLASDFANLPGDLGELARELRGQLGVGGGVEQGTELPQESDIESLPVSEVAPGMLSKQHRLTLWLETDASSGDTYAQVSLWVNADAAPTHEMSILIAIDLAVLHEFAHDSLAYGRMLSTMLFATDALRDVWVQAIRTDFLHIQISLASASDALHAVAWERLCDPRNGEPLVASGRAMITRLMATAQPAIRPGMAMGPIGMTYASFISMGQPAVRQLVSGTPIQVVLAAPAPTDLGRYNFPEPAGIGRVMERWQQRDPSLSQVRSVAAPITISNLQESLRSGSDLLYLTCEVVSVVDDENNIFFVFEDQQRNVSFIRLEEFSQRLRSLSTPPILMVLSLTFRTETSGQVMDILSRVSEVCIAANVGMVLAVVADRDQRTHEDLIDGFENAILRNRPGHRALAEAVSQRGPTANGLIYLLASNRTDGNLWSTEAVARPTQEPRVIELTVVELNLRGSDPAQLSADLRVTSAAATLAVDVPVRLDLPALRELANDPAAYGTELSRQLFADQRLREAWLKVRAHAADAILQLRLNLPASAEDLHALHWETLCDPETDQPLALSERVRLVRTIDTADLTPIMLRPRPNLWALVIVSNPSDLGDFNLAEVDVDGEVARMRTALGDIPCTILGDHADAVGRATLTQLTAQLRRAPPLVFVVAHGTLQDDGPCLWLEQEDGTSDRVAGTAFVQAIERLTTRPLLLALLSCQSAGRGYGDTLSALGPQLIRIGIPAAMAFHGDVAMSTVKVLLPTLISELARDGQLDRALAATRAALGENKPWWQAVAWLRTDGRVWQEEAAVPPVHQAWPLVYLSDAGGSGSEQLYPNGVTPEGEPLLQIDAASIFRIAQAIANAMQTTPSQRAAKQRSGETLL